MAIGLFVHNVSRSWFLVAVLDLVGFSVSYSGVIKFEKSDALFSVNFGDFVSDIELETKMGFGNSLLTIFTARTPPLAPILIM